MSCKISRRNFMKCAGVGALAAVSAGALGGCTKFDAEYGLHEVAAFTNKKGGSFSLAFTEAREITATQNADLAEKYQLKTDEGQRYVYLLAEVTNGTGGKVDLYDRRFKWDIINNIFNPVNYDDEDMRDWIEENRENSFDTMADLYGKGWTYEYEIVDEDPYRDSELEDVEDFYDDAEADVPDVSEGREYEVEVTVVDKDGDDEEERTMTIGVVKSNGHWYLDPMRYSLYL